MHYYHCYMTSFKPKKRKNLKKSAKKIVFTLNSHE